MVTNLIIGRIYVARFSGNSNEHDAFPDGTRVEFIGGPDDDIISNGEQWDFLGIYDSLEQTDDQTPLAYSEQMAIGRSEAMTGEQPECELMTGA